MSLSRFVALLIATLIIVVPLQRTSASSAAAKTSPGQSAGCSTAGINARVADGHLDRALAMAEGCASTYKSSISDFSASSDLSFDQWTDVLIAGYYLCAAVQIHLLRGDTPGAEAALRELELYSTRWGHYLTSPLLNWHLTLASTKGFYLEKTGQTEAAKHWYEEHPSSHALARRAVITLAEKDYQEAGRLAQAALASGSRNATAYFVLGRLAEAAGDMPEAGDHYRTAANLLQELGKGNPILPVELAEARHVKTALQRIGQ